MGEAKSKDFIEKYLCIPVELIEEFKQESFRSYRKIQFGMVGCEDTQKRIIKSTAREVMYNGINLLTLGGRDDNEKARRIARKLWTIEELRKIVIDNTRRSGTRKAAVHIELSCSEMQ